MVEQTRALFVEARIYRDTNKMTYDDREQFDSVEEAVAWLRGDDEPMVTLPVRKLRGWEAALGSSFDDDAFAVSEAIRTTLTEEGHPTAGDFLGDPESSESEVVSRDASRGVGPAVGEGL